MQLGLGLGPGRAGDGAGELVPGELVPGELMPGDDRAVGAGSAE
jgi:hypothetical protein